MESVKRGWQGMSEVNHVVFDPEQVSVAQLVNWLKESGTYIRTIALPDQHNGDKEPGDE